MPTDMDTGNNENLKKQYDPFTDSHLEHLMQQVGAGSPTGQTIREILAERRALPEKQFEKTYKLARIAAVVSIAGALAAFASALAVWASVWFQSVQPRVALDEFRQHQTASITPTPSPSPSP
jgi:hypothetical protein